MVYRLIVPLDMNHHCDGDFESMEVAKMAISKLLRDNAVPTFIVVKLGEQYDRKREQVA